MMIPQRQYSAGNSYRYGFNGKENDNEVKGVEGSQQDYGMRIYDPKVGRFLSVDPIAEHYPELTPYQFASNTPIWAIDIDGLEGGIASPMGGQNVVDTKTAERAAGWFSRPASRWMKMGLAAQMNANQSVHKYTEDDFPKLTNGEYLAASVGQSLINNNQTGRSQFTLRGKPTPPQTPKAEVEPNAGTVKTTIATSKSTATSTQQQSIAATGTNKNQITAKITDPQDSKYYGAKTHSYSDGLIKIDNKNASGTFDFVVTNEGKLVIGSGHYNLSSSAKTVQAAGRLVITDGKISTINNRSGHYQPTVEEAKSFGTVLQNAGVNVSGAQLDIYNKNSQRVNVIKL